MIPVGPRLIALAILTALGASVVYQQLSGSTASAAAQTRKQQKRTSPKRASGIQSRTRTNVGPGSFKHEHHRLPKAKLNCSNCHAIPSLATPDLVAAATKTSIKGYPYHDSCLECHRVTAPQFFRGTTPVICTVCHTRSGPRLTARDLSAFPKPSRATAPELLGYFSHGIREHQRVTRDCTTCHMKDERVAVAIQVGGGETPYQPADGTFKTSPAGHASCFENCHWDKDDPKKDNCAGCHLTAEAIAKRQRNLLSRNAVEWFKRWPSEWPKRLSIKFSHESKNHREAENPELVCTSCHVNINQSETLDIPNVPIATCAKSGCHLDPASRTSIGKEMFQEDDDIGEGRNSDPSSKAGQHTCTGCHTDVIGSAPPPCSHYLLFDDDRYFKIEDYPKSAKQLFEQCKK